MTHPQARSQPGTTARPRTAATARAPAVQPDHAYGPTARAYPAAPADMRPGPVGGNFGAASDQTARPDTLPATPHARARHHGQAPEPSWPETGGPRITALARHDPETGTVTLVLDATTASVAMFAIAAHAD